MLANEIVKWVHPLEKNEEETTQAQHTNTLTHFVASTQTCQGIKTFIKWWFNIELIWLLDMPASKMVSYITK